MARLSAATHLRSTTDRTLFAMDAATAVVLDTGIGVVSPIVTILGGIVGIFELLESRKQ